MKVNDDGKPSAFERAALDTLAVVIGAMIAFLLWDAVVNLVIFHSLTPPRHIEAEGATFGEGFALMVLIPCLIVVMPLSIFVCLNMLRKLR